MGLKQFWQRLKTRFTPNPLETAIYEFLDYVALGPLRSASVPEIQLWFHKAEMAARRVQGLCRAEIEKKIFEGDQVEEG